MTDIIEDELFEHEIYKKIKKLKKFRYCQITKEPTQFAYKIAICANSAIYVKTLYENDLVKEEARGEAINKLLNDAYSTLSQYKV